jgi:hypothetical protein
MIPLPALGCVAYYQQQLDKQGHDNLPANCKKSTKAITAASLDQFLPDEPETISVSLQQLMNYQRQSP